MYVGTQCTIGKTSYKNGNYLKYFGFTQCKKFLKEITGASKSNLAFLKKQTFFPINCVKMPRTTSTIYLYGTLTDPEYTNFCGSTDNSSLACLSLTCLNVPTMDVCSGSLLFSLVLMSTVFSSRLRLLLTYVSPSDNCIEIEAGIARTLQFPVLKYMCANYSDGITYPKFRGLLKAN